MRRQLLRHNFWAARFDPGRHVSRITRQVALSELALCIFAVALIAGVLVLQDIWLTRTRADVAALEVRAKETSLERLRVEAMLAHAGQAKKAIVYAERVRRSGPILARRIAALAAYMPEDASASSLDARAQTWSFNGHVTSYAQLGSILEMFDSQALAPVLSESETDGPRIKFAVALPGAPPQVR